MDEKKQFEDDKTQPDQVVNEETQKPGTQAARRQKTRRRWLAALGVVAAVAVILLALYQIPAIHSRAYYYVNTLRSKVYYFFRPPAASEFEISGEATLNSEVVATLTALAPTATLMPTVPPTHEITATSSASPTMTPVPTAIPESVQLEGVVQEYQRLNSCGPTNLALLLRYWGWVGEQTDIEHVVKPRLEDLNVTPYEMLAYVQGHTEQDVVLRLGGTLDLLKRLVAAGYPVLVERGYVNRDDEWNGWMGHYGVVDGYDDAQQAVHIPDTGNGYIWVKYDLLQQGWDEFSGTCLVIVPPQEREIVLGWLGPDAQPEYNLNTTLEKIRERSETAVL